MNKKIFHLLKELNLTSKKTRELYSKRTRDNSNVKVWKDKISGVIYIDDFYTGDSTYIDGNYRKDKKLNSKNFNFESNIDLKRRLKENIHHYYGKNVIEFGCGNGDFLYSIKPFTKKIVGIELQKDFLKNLDNNNIECHDSLIKTKNNFFDVCFTFHVLEHLPDPIFILKTIKKKLKRGGKIIIEVPHANDFLLTLGFNENFKQFTLWSQHLILHTRESLKKILILAGFKEIIIKGIQRYPLSNHLNWFVNGLPEGHTSKFSIIDNVMLNEEYSKTLSKIDSNDTLIAIAKV